jgi:hypothetical protein
VTTHLVLFRPRPDLTAPERNALVGAFSQAVHTIPSVRGVRVGRRVAHDAGYQQGMPDAADYLVALDFDDEAGLAAYLAHPAHTDLGSRFNAAVAAALIYDFASMPLDEIVELVTPPPTEIA